ncbi:hypothetical protein D3C81_2010230 [compost metagenome]
MVWRSSIADSSSPCTNWRKASFTISRENSRKVLKKNILIRMEKWVLLDRSRISFTSSVSYEKKRFML